MMSFNINIDFFEFAFLVEACIPPVPIARSSFWNKVIDTYYHDMNPMERTQLHGWVTRCSRFNIKNEECKLFDDRFNPFNQYRVYTKYEGKEEIHETFKRGDRYHLTSIRSILDEYITKVEPIIDPIFQDT